MVLIVALHGCAEVAALSRYCTKSAISQNAFRGKIVLICMLPPSRIVSKLGTRKYERGRQGTDSPARPRRRTRDPLFAARLHLTGCLQGSWGLPLGAEHSVLLSACNHIWIRIRDDNANAREFVGLQR